MATYLPTAVTGSRTWLFVVLELPRLPLVTCKMLPMLLRVVDVHPFKRAPKHGLLQELPTDKLSKWPHRALMAVLRAAVGAGLCIYIFIRVVTPDPVSV